MILIISFLIATIIFSIWAMKKNEKEKNEYFARIKETFKEAIKEALKEREEEMFNDFDDFDPFEPQDDESDNLHKIVEKDIDDLEYTIRKEMKNNE